MEGILVHLALVYSPTGSDSISEAYLVKKLPRSNSFSLLFNNDDDGGNEVKFSPTCRSQQR